MSAFSLSAGEIHVWSLPLAATAEQLAALYATLAADESDRADRYRHEPSRQQYVQARATLRALLGRYLGAPPAGLHFTHSAQGKPALPGGGLHFNVSHTHGLALIAVTREGEVGVDVERVRNHPTHLDLAARYFTPAEAAALRRLPAGASEEAFFHVWTRKEAFLKAVGLGLAHGLERFEVSVPPDDPARVLHIDGDPAAGARWSMVALAPAPGYVGTLAIEGRVRVELREWPGSEGGSSVDRIVLGG
jgi:4'-phosphopantetheinyl transferase